MTSLKTLPDVLAGSPNSPALYIGSDGPTITRGELGKLVSDFASDLRQHVTAGDVVTIVDPNTVEFVVAFLACSQARAIAAPLNQSYTTEEFQFYMEDAGSKLLVVGANGNPSAEAAKVAPFTLSLKVDTNGKTVTSNVVKRDSRSQEEGPLLPDPADEALFLHTSGTTSRPKGVPLTQSNLVASIQNMIATYEFTPQDVSLLVMPLFHVHGLMCGLLSPLAAGAAVVLPEEGRFSAKSFWKDAVARHITFYTAVPTMHQILISRAKDDYPSDNPPPLRVIRSCSSSLAPSTLQAVEATFKAPVLEAYAMTEASHQMTSNPLPQSGPHKPGSVGMAQGSVKVAILDDTCNVLGPGEVGEVCIRGPNVTAGYKNNPKANEEAYMGGWFHTGDQGYLDEEGYLTLTGRLKELINRGGEKISPIEVDSTLLSHPDVAEAVSFALPDTHYGEVVAAGIVLKDGTQPDAASIRQHVASKLAAFKVPKEVFFLDSLPKNPTGKVQRRFMLDICVGKPEKMAAFPFDGYFLTAQALKRLGIEQMYGVIGIPVTAMASAAQACGIRFISFRNEQAAGYAAAASGFLTGKPGVLLTVSGPGFVHALAALHHAQINCWPLVVMSGSSERNEVGQGAFQELDQVAAAQQYVVYSAQARCLDDVPRLLSEAFEATIGGRPGPAYIDLPSDILMATGDGGGSDTTSQEALLVDAIPARPPGPFKPPAADAEIAAACELLHHAQKPLVVIGKGAAFARSEEQLRHFIDRWQMPFIAMPMGRGVIPDDHALCTNAARSKALLEADVVLLFGARLNWQLHFGMPPKWSASVKFILIDVEPSARDASVAAQVLHGDAGTVALQLVEAMEPISMSSHWISDLQSKVGNAKEKLKARLSVEKYPLDYGTALKVIRDELNALEIAPIVCSEGANTMDQGRMLLEPVTAPRTRLDAGTAGTMGVGLGSAIAAAVTASAGQRVVALEGDSAFGFSGMEIETMCRYKLPITVIIFNNGGIYGGDRRDEELKALAVAGLKGIACENDPPPTAFVENSKYELLALAFGGRGVAVTSAGELRKELNEALRASIPTIINVQIDPLAGVESGNVHSFNAPKSSHA